MTTTKRKAHNTTWENGINYKGNNYSGPYELYEAADKERRIKLSTFNGRLLRRQKAGENITDAVIEECLYVSAKDYQKQYGERKSYTTVNGEKVDLREVHQKSRSSLPYSTFWQRVRRLEKDDLLTKDTLQEALEMASDEWVTHYGGGRYKTFLYQGELHPDLNGQKFRSITAFLRAIGRYDDRITIHKRLNAGWDIDPALEEAVIPVTSRKGTIYKATRKSTGQIYVGQTILSTESRWKMHLFAARNGVQTPLATAICEDGDEGFLIRVLEEGLEPNQLGEREIYWIKKLGTLYPNGLNANKGGSIGGAKRKKVEYKGETFPSLEECSTVLSERTGLAKHVIERRLRNGQELPESARKRSYHPEAGTYYWRRWKSHMKSPKRVHPDWHDYDAFKRDTIGSFHDELFLTRIDKSKPLGPANFRWVSQTERNRHISGVSLIAFGKTYSSYSALAEEFGIGVSTIKNRIVTQGMSPEEAVSKKLGPTSTKRVQPIRYGGKEFPSVTQAAKALAPEYSLTFDQARDRLRRGVPLG